MKRPSPDDFTEWTAAAEKERNCVEDQEDQVNYKKKKGFIEQIFALQLL